MKDPGLSLSQEQKLRLHSFPPWGHMDPQVTEIMENLGFTQESLTGRKQCYGSGLMPHTGKTKMKAVPSGQGPASPLTPTSLSPTQGVQASGQKTRYPARTPTLPGGQGGHSSASLEVRTAPHPCPQSGSGAPPSPPSSSSISSSSYLYAGRPEVKIGDSQGRATKPLGPPATPQPHPLHCNAHCEGAELREMATGCGESQRPSQRKLCVQVRG